MKKINLLIAAGLMASASLQAQTVIASLGFEDGDQTGRTSQYALTPGLSIFGDFVNVKNQAFMDNPDNKVVSHEGVDEWNEKYADEKHSGSYAFQAVNCEGWVVSSPTDEDPEKTADGVSQTWDRGFKIANLPVKQDKAYRVSFWIKGDEGAKCSSWLSQGIENFDKSACTSSNYNYGINQATLTGEWQFKSFVAFVNSDRINKGMESWTGGATYPVEWGGDGSKTYRQFYEDKLPQEFFFIVNMFSPGATYLLDDIKIEEDVYINKVYFNFFNADEEENANVLKLDFGYQTNAKTLAQSAGGIYVLKTEKAGVSVTVNGEPAEVLTMEAHADGNVYIFLDEDELTYDETAQIVVSYTPSADSPLLYEGQVRPSADYDTPLQVKGFSNEAAWFDETITETSSLWAPPVAVSTVPENGSFELESATLTNISVKFDKEVEVSSATATLDYKGSQIPLDDIQVDATDPTVVNIAVSGLADGQYKFILTGVASQVAGIEMTSDVTIEFSVGEDSGSGSGSFEEIWSDNIATVGENMMPAGWTGAGETELQGGVEAKSVGGAPRTMFGETAKNHGIYISGRDKRIGTLAYGKAAIETIDALSGEMPEPSEDVALYLEPGKYNIYYRMARWDQNNGSNGQTITMAVYDAAGQPALAPTELTVTDQVKNAWAGDATWVTDATADGLITKRSMEVTIPAAGYYYIEFATNSAAMGVSYFLTGLSIESKPSSAAAEQKAKLAAAAEKYQPTMEAAEDEQYNGDTKTAFVAAFNSVQNDRFHTVSEVDAAIANLEALATKMETRIKNINDWSTSVSDAASAYDALDSKYQRTSMAQDAKTLIDTYVTIDPSELSDDELNTVTPKLVAVATKMANVKGVVDALTWGLYKATETYGKIGSNNESAFNAALDAITDDRDVANLINAANKLRVLQILAEVQKAGEGAEIPSEYLTTAGDVTGIELTGFIQNPKLYRELGNSGVPGWNIEAGSAESSLNISFGGEAPSEAKPVTDQEINIYGNADYDMYQTLENLPAGVYAVKFNTRTPQVDKMDTYGKIFYYNAQNDDTGEWDKYIYAGDEGVAPYKGGSWSNGEANFTYITDLEVGEEGTLLIGAREHYVSGKAEKHEDNTPQSFWTGTTMCDDVRIFLVDLLEGYDYIQAAEEEATGIDNVKAGKAAQKGAIFNVAGQKVDASYKGIVIKAGKKYYQK